MVKTFFETAYIAQIKADLRYWNALVENFGEFNSEILFTSPEYMNQSLLKLRQNYALASVNCWRAYFSRKERSKR